MSMNPFRKPQVQYFEFGTDSAQQIDELIQAVKARDVEGLHEKLNAIVEMLRAQANVATDLGLVKEELSTVHGLLADLVSADPEKIKEITNAVRSVKEKLQSSVNSQKER